MLVELDEKYITQMFLGVPYKHKGRDLNGLDCYGLVILLYRERGYEVLDIEADYDEDWRWKGKDYFIENYHKQWIKLDRPKYLDTVLFKNNKGVAIHGGICLNNGRFIHTCKAGTVISRWTDPIWLQKIEGFYRLKNVDS